MIRRSALLLGFTALLAAQASAQVHVWSQRFGDSGTTAGRAIALDASGNAFVAAQFDGTVNFGGGLFTSMGSVDIALAKFAADGTHIWSSRFGDAASEVVTGLAVDAWGNVVAIGSFVGTIDFGGGVLTSAGVDDIWIAKFDPNGNNLWSRRFGGSGLEVAEGVAVDGTGNVLVTGHFQGVLDFGGGPLVSATADVFVVKLDMNGNHVWSRSYGDPGNEVGEDIAVDDLGNVIVSGHFNGTIDFGGGVLTSASTQDIFVVKLDPNGSHVWSQHFGSVASQALGGMTTDGANVIMTGWFNGSIDFGGAILTSSGASDVFFAKLDVNGGHMWSKRFGDAASQNGADVGTYGGAGMLVMTGNFTGSMDLGGGPLVGSGDIFMAKFDPAGTHLWSEGFGGSIFQLPFSLDASRGGDVAVTGFFNGAIDFGGGTLTSLGNNAFAVKFNCLPTITGGVAYCIEGVSTGGDYSWFIDLNGNGGVDPDEPVANVMNTVPPAGGADLLADELVASINANSSGSPGVMAALTGFLPECFTIRNRCRLFHFCIANNCGEPCDLPSSVPPLPELYVGPPNDPTSCLVTATGCAYNPTVRRFADVTDVPDSNPEHLAGAPNRTVLHASIPNPLNPTTIIRFDLAQDGVVTLRVFDVSGRLVRTLIDDTLARERHSILWDGMDDSGAPVSSGLYFYRLETAGFTDARKMVVVR